MFQKIKNWFRRDYNDGKVLFDRWEKMSGASEPKKDNSVSTSPCFNDISLFDAEQERLRENRKKEAKYAVIHVEDELCASCKKKLPLNSADNDPAIVKIVCNSTVIYRFHLDCWKSINNILNNKFEIKDGIEVLGE